MTDKPPATKPVDKHPHSTVAAAGAEAARKGLPVHTCPYSHPAMRASWIKGFAQEQQLSLDLF